MRFRLNIDMSSISSIRIFRVMLALAVALWMAGAGCMLGCEKMVAAAAANEHMSPANAYHANSNTIVSGDACASMHSHDCCARRGAGSAAQPAQAAVQSNARPDDGWNAAANSRTAAPAIVSSLVAELTAPFSAMTDCPLAVNATAALSKARPDQATVAAPLTRPNFAPPPLQELTTAQSPPLVLPNRGHTYLRCCVFLI